jgi:DNA-binding response OmpR family regulator
LMSAPEPGSAARRVLVIDGDRALRNLFCRVLDHDGRFEVAGAVGSCERAIAFEGAFDMALVDILVDQSLDLVSVFRARVPSPAIFVRAPVTATYLRAAAVDAGASGFVVNAAGMAELLDRMAEHLPSTALRHLDEGRPHERSGSRGGVRL